MPKKTDQNITTLLRGAIEIISPEQLDKKIHQSKKKGQPLRIKAGFDPTAPDIHLGHAVLLEKLRQFQDAGHCVYFLIGDFTAQIGDPSGRDQMRPKMTPEQIKKNATTYKKQVFKILDEKKTKVIFNSAWLKKLTAQDILALSARVTVAQMLARADFKKRFEKQREISLLEFIYPLLQGYDSVYLKADVELGGSDQKFNLLMGRQLQESYGQEPQVVMMMPLLEGTDGIQKMSKSLGNYIGVNEPAKEIFGKTMSLSDTLMMRYYELLTTEDLKVRAGQHPKDAKMDLAEILVKKFYAPKEAAKARLDFERTFSQNKTPEDMPRYALKSSETLLDVLVASKLVASKSEARRLIREGAVSLNREKIYEETAPLKKGVLKVGKRRFLEVTRRA